jgi:hypothetical protein
VLPGGVHILHAISSRQPHALNEQLMKASLESDCHAFLASADELVGVSLTVVNTGSLRITNLQLSVPPMVSAGLTCQLQSVPETPYSFGTASVLQPGEVVMCTKQYAVTTADIEANARNVQVTVAGDAANGQAPSDFGSVLITSEPRYMLEVEVLADGCNKPMQPGG